MNTKSKIFSTRSLVVTGALVAAGILVFGVTAASGASEPANAGSAGTFLEPVDATLADYGIASLSQSRGAVSEPIPSEIRPEDLGNEGLNVDSAHFLGEANGAKYWAALDNTGRLCLVAYIPGDDWVAGTGCQDPEAFKALGTNIRLTSPAGDLEAYLVADTDDAASTSAARVSGAGITKNLFVIPTQTTVEDRNAFKAELADQGVEIGVISNSRSDAEAQYRDGGTR